METFYDALFTSSGNVDFALIAMRQALNPCPLRFFSSKNYVERGLKSYVETSCVGDGFNIRMESLVEQARKQVPDGKIDMKLVNEIKEKELRDTPMVLRRMAEHFLHINGSNGNAERFSPDLEATLADIQNMLDGDRK